MGCSFQVCLKELHLNTDTLKILGSYPLTAIPEQ